MGQRLTPIVKYLLIINIALLILPGLFGYVPADIFGLRFFTSSEFQPYQIFTHMFAHGGFWHLLGNMFALYIFGTILEAFWGSERFLFFYLATGLLASVFFLSIEAIEIYNLNNDKEAYMETPSPDALRTFYESHPSRLAVNSEFMEVYFKNPKNEDLISESKEVITALYNSSYEIKVNTPLVGASGAVFGILIAFAMLFPNVELMLLFLPFPIKAKYFVGIYLAYEVYMGLKNLPQDNVAHMAHVGGALVGFLLVKFWNRNKNRMN